MNSWCICVILSVSSSSAQTSVSAEVPTHVRKLSAVLLRRILIQDENSAYSELSESRCDMDMTWMDATPPAHLMLCGRLLVVFSGK